ncbi:hypothetical protein EKE94_17325 [Mesobaculum littorinae]|uniref:Succinate dehydrogenase n=1 Tax=Mesobaculum littorinae TaxID=2486419 RepID=A0A438ADC6_9RHOB|nr:hypothetical protein [Mesobaculum littorinae]RVV96642.1 hypothetical protein EKE94_17325 [Mesobaculum littorinae]
MTGRLVVLTTILLAACSPNLGTDLTRASAKSAVRPVLAQRMPGVNAEPAVNCVIDNASSTEIRALASDAVTGPTEATVQTVAGVLGRPGTVTCLQAAIPQMRL